VKKEGEFKWTAKSTHPGAAQGSRRVGGGRAQENRVRGQKDKTRGQENLTRGQENTLRGQQNRGVRGEKKQGQRSEKPGVRKTGVQGFKKQAGVKKIGSGVKKTLGPMACLILF